MTESTKRKAIALSNGLALADDGSIWKLSAWGNPENPSYHWQRMPDLPDAPSPS